LILFGGTPPGQLDADLRIINAVIAAAAVGLYLLRAPDSADRVDRGVVIAVFLFALASLFSWFPRQSFDAVLGCLGYAAGLYVARDVLSGRVSRSMFLATAMVLAAATTAIATIRWVPTLFDWLRLSSGLLPPLGLNLDGWIWGHRYDLSLLMVLLYPAWWAGRPGTVRKTVAVLLGVVIGGLVLLGGSRTLWFACVVASTVFLLPSTRGVWERGRRALQGSARPIVLVGIAAAVLAITTGVLAVAVDRLLSIGTLSSRTDMWSLLAGLWLRHPLAGLGPGSFPWDLQLTGYFDTNTFAPRHPDSALFQLLPEAGILGLAACAALALAVIPALARAGRTPALWALLVWAITGIGTNPTEFTFLVVPAIAWLAYALPHPPQPAQQLRLLAPSRLLLAGAALVLAMPLTVTLVAAHAYEDARNSIASGKLDAGARQLSEAISLDPGMAIYWRQRGELSMLTGHPIGAISDLRQAAAINPEDDLAWRALALAYDQTGEADKASASITNALRVQRSDATSLLVAAWIDRSMGDNRAAIELLGEAVQAWPTLIGAPGWARLVPNPSDSRQILSEAIGRWDDGARPLQPPIGQGLWLALFANRPDLSTSGPAADGVSPGIAKAFLAVFGCHPEANQILNGVSDPDRRSAFYWLTRLRAAINARGRDEQALKLFQILPTDSLAPSAQFATRNPLDENGWQGYSADAWGYRRFGIHWPSYSLALPSSAAGLARWVWDASGSAQDAGLTGRVSAC
jgi:tetratricopeptide (TPR) repeat protein